MRIKILYVCFTLSILLNMLLSVHLLRREPVCRHIHVDEIDRTKDVIPDAETAVRMAREKCLDSTDGYPYEYLIFFNRPSYEWIVFIQLKKEDRYAALGGRHVVWMRRDYGIVSNHSH